MCEHTLFQEAAQCMERTGLWTRRVAHASKCSPQEAHTRGPLMFQPGLETPLKKKKNKKPKEAFGKEAKLTCHSFE